MYSDYGIYQLACDFHYFHAEEFLQQQFSNLTCVLPQIPRVLMLF